MSSRVEYYDFLRGVAIIMVVGIHTFASSSLDSIYGFISMLVREVLNCAVPIFLAISGFFCGKKLLCDQNAKFAFWKKQIPKIYIPALIWSVPYFVLNIIGNDGVFGIGEQILALFTCSYSIYYFIALIIQYYLLLPVLQKHGSVMMPISVILSFVSIISITYITEIKGVELPVILYAGPFTTWFVFFMSGVYLSTRTATYTIKHAIFLIIMGLMLECVETYWLNTYHGGGYGIKFSAFLYSIGIVLLILSPKLKEAYKTNIITSMIAYLGKISFGIYLIHYFTIKVFDILLPIKSWLFSWLLVLTVTSVVVVSARKILPDYLNRYLGFS